MRERRTTPKDAAPVSPPLLIQEQLSTQAINALMANYRDPQQAVMELVDNAVDNRSENKQLTIIVRATREELAISNQGGKGLDFEGLDNYFTWGHSDKTASDIGQFGVGGKAAMGYLGRGMEIVCSKDGTDREYRVSDPAWETREQGELKQYTPEERTAKSIDGYFSVKVTDIKRDINSHSLATKLADIYRPLLMDGSIKIIINGRVIDPLKIDYVEDTEELIPEHAKFQTRGGDWFELKVGVLKPGQKIKPGIRLYYRGRLIEDGQFFDHPSPAQMSGSSRLIGEAHLDHIKVTTNKSTFDRGTIQWLQAHNRIHGILTPWMEKLAKLRSSEGTTVERYEKDLAKEAKRILEGVLANQQIITKGVIPGQAAGRIPPRSQDIYPPKPTTGRTHVPTEGKTAPDFSARGEKVKRWGALHEVDVVDMGNDQTRAVIIEENGRLILKINAGFPLYQTAKVIGTDAQQVYMGETLVMELVKKISKDKTVEEYVETVNELLRECGHIFKNRVRNRSNRSSGRK